MKYELCILQVICRNEKGRITDCYFRRMQIPWDCPYPMFSIRITNADTAGELSLGHSYKIRSKDGGLSYDIKEA